MQDTGSLGLVHWDDLGGWYGEGKGRGVQDGEHVYTRGGCMLMYGKLPFFKILVNHFMAWDDSPGANVISKQCCW